MRSQGARGGGARSRDARGHGGLSKVSRPGGLGKKSSLAMEMVHFGTLAKRLFYGVNFNNALTWGFAKTAKRGRLRGSNFCSQTRKIGQNPCLFVFEWSKILLWLWKGLVWGLWLGGGVVVGD